jgi:hypothetical protein
MVKPLSKTGTKDGAGVNYDGRNHLVAGQSAQFLHPPLIIKNMTKIYF